MPSVFLSYASANERQATEFARELGALGVSVWRDQDSLRPGENWAKAIGEAIAAHDVVVLLWSGEAAKSEWVEREWSTALAMRKPVLPCVTDGTLLPPSLAGVQAVRATVQAEAAGKIAASLGLLVKPAEQPRKVRWRRWAAWVAILVALVVAGIWAGREPHEPAVAGIIGDENGQPLPGVQVTVLIAGKTGPSRTTNSVGHYSFTIPAAPGTEVLLVAAKDGFRTEQRYARLGNTDFGFNMTKEPK